MLSNLILYTVHCTISIYLCIVDMHEENEDPKTEDKTEAVTFENMYFALLGAAEDFRTAKIPDIRKSIHCLEAILICNPPPRIEVRHELLIKM